MISRWLKRNMYAWLYGANLPWWRRKLAVLSWYRRAEKLMKRKEQNNA